MKRGSKMSLRRGARALKGYQRHEKEKQSLFFTFRKV